MTGREQTRRDAPKAEKILRLGAIRNELADLELKVYALRLERDALALALIENHDLTWRESAEYAGFENPYIAKLLRDRRVTNG